VGSHLLLMTLTIWRIGFGLSRLVPVSNLGPSTSWAGSFVSSQPPRSSAPTWGLDELRCRGTTPGQASIRKAWSAYSWLTAIRSVSVWPPLCIATVSFARPPSGTSLRNGLVRSSAGSCSAASTRCNRSRARAEHAVRPRALDPELSIRYSAPMVDAVALITAERLNRPWTASLRTELLHVLVRPEQRAELRSAAWSRDRPTRRAAVALLVRHDDLLGLLRTQLRRDDVVAVTTVAQAALATPAICAEAAEILLGSRNARLRAEGLWHLVDHAHHSEEAINNGLADPAPNVRSVAQYLAARKGAVPRDWYLSQVPRDPVGALLGLGDVRSATDVELAAPFLDSHDSRQRAAAVRLVARTGTRTSRSFSLRSGNGDASLETPSQGSSGLESTTRSLVRR
jgi:hypothetical protein